jgi:hypothetical protein
MVPGLLRLSLMQPAAAQEVKRAVKVAAVDFIPAWGDLEGNSRRHAQAAERVAAQGVDDAVCPETAISGYDFTEPAQLAPYVDTIPGRATAALLPVLKRTGLIMSVGIAERDAITSLFYNTAVLMGPEGIIGKYRNIGLNGQDVQLFGPGDTDVGVFAHRSGALPSSFATTMASDQQHMRALNGVFVEGATRSGIERNTITGSQLYDNGGSSIWSPLGHKLVQAPVVPPETLPPGPNGWITTTIIPAEADAVRQRRLAARRPSLYNPLLVLRRASVDSSATVGKRPVQLASAHLSDSEMAWAS